MLGGGHALFCALLLDHLGICINSSKSESHLTQHFCFLGIFWHVVDMTVSLPTNAFRDAMVGFPSVANTACFSPSGHAFLGNASFCASGHT